MSTNKHPLTPANCDTPREALTPDTPEAIYNEMKWMRGRLEILTRKLDYLSFEDPPRLGKTRAAESAGVVLDLMLRAECTVGAVYGFLPEKAAVR